MKSKKETLSMEKNNRNLKRNIRKNYTIIISVIIFLISFSLLLTMCYLLENSRFYTFIIEIGYAFMFYVPFFFIIRYISKSRYQFYLINLLVALSAYTALFASLMTKITPILSDYKYFPLVDVIYLISAGLANISSYLYIIFVVTDRKLIMPLQSIIKKKKSVESELRSQKRELSMFNRIIAHDIKNNLTNIKGFSELFIKDQENYEIIKRQIAQIQELLENSLKLAAAGKIIDESEPVDLNKLISDIMKDIIPNGVELIQQIIPIVYGDKQKLRQAFKNILENAIIHGKPQTIEVSSEFEQKTLFIKICDDGAKISKEIIQNFSNEDYMVDLKKNHLGLKIIKRIINAHDWGIKIKNDPFTTYVIRIPEGHYRIDTQIK